VNCSVVATDRRLSRTSSRQLQGQDEARFDFEITLTVTGSDVAEVEAAQDILAADLQVLKADTAALAASIMSEIQNIDPSSSYAIVIQSFDPPTKADMTVVVVSASSSTTAEPEEEISLKHLDGLKTDSEREVSGTEVGTIVGITVGISCGICLPLGVFVVYRLTRDKEEEKNVVTPEVQIS